MQENLEVQSNIRSKWKEMLPIWKKNILIEFMPSNTRLVSNISHIITIIAIEELMNAANKNTAYVLRVFLANFVKTPPSFIAIRGILLSNAGAQLWS